MTAAEGPGDLKTEDEPLPDFLRRGREEPSTPQPTAARSAAQPRDWVETLRLILASAQTHNVRTLEVETRGFRVLLRRAGPQRHPHSADPLVALSSPTSADLHAIRCPLTGIWYDSPSPGSPPFVQPGDAIDVGTVVGLVETMKVFNEVTSDAEGIVRAVLVRRGDLLEANVPVMTLEPLRDVAFPGDFP